MLRIKDIIKDDKITVIDMYIGECFCWNSSLYQVADIRDFPGLQTKAVRLNHRYCWDFKRHKMVTFGLDAIIVIVDLTLEVDNAKN